jgi:hypothetical protein
MQKGDLKRPERSLNFDQEIVGIVDIQTLHHLQQLFDLRDFVQNLTTQKDPPGMDEGIQRLFQSKTFS